jgi:hypothetical protein
MGRDREYADNADRQRAYRQRKAEEEARLREELRRARGEVGAKTAPHKQVRLRLAKILGMLGSAHAGERDAAFLAAERILKEAGMTWYDAFDIPLKDRT